MRKDKLLYLFAECIPRKVYLVCLQCSESGRSMHIGVILCNCLIAHCSLSNFIVTLLQMLLPVDYVASPDAVNALPCVHVQCLPAFGQLCPSIAASHWFLSKLLDSASWKLVEKHIISLVQISVAVVFLIVLGGIWQQVQLCLSLQRALQSHQLIAEPCPISVHLP